MAKTVLSSGCEKSYSAVRGDFSLRSKWQQVPAIAWFRTDVRNLVLHSEEISPCGRNDCRPRPPRHFKRMWEISFRGARRISPCGRNDSRPWPSRHFERMWEISFRIARRFLPAVEMTTGPGHRVISSGCEKSRSAVRGDFSLRSKWQQGLAIASFRTNVSNPIPRCEEISPCGRNDGRADRNDGSAVGMAKGRSEWQQAADHDRGDRTAED